jgi:hypothetical protein
MEYPDYIGAWSAGGFWDLESIMPSQSPANNQFYIFVESRESKKEGLHFKGRGQDKFGKSKIEGIITKTNIEFTKVYDENAIKTGGARGTLKHRGVREEYKKDQTSPQTSLYAGIIIGEHLSPRTFIMKSLEER